MFIGSLSFFIIAYWLDRVLEEKARKNREELDEVKSRLFRAMEIQERDMCCRLEMMSKKNKYLERNKKE